MQLVATNLSLTVQLKLPTASVKPDNQELDKLGLLRFFRGSLRPPKVVPYLLL